MKSFEKIADQVEILEKKILEAMKDEKVANFLAMLSKQEELLPLLKEAAREKAVIGKTTLIEDEFLTVSVTGKKRKYDFVWAKAVENWPEDLIERVRVFEIDPKKVETEIKLGNLKQQEANLARKIRPEETPSVEIRFVQREKK